MRLFIKRKQEQDSAFYIVYSELSKMCSVFVGANAAAVVVCILYTVFGDGDWRLFTGLAAGNILSVANFILLGVMAENSLRRRTAEKVRFAANMAYGVRYVALFAICAILLMFKAVNIVTLLFPLFLPRTYYLLAYTPLAGKGKRTENIDFK